MPFPLCFVKQNYHFKNDESHETSESHETYREDEFGKCLRFENSLETTNKFSSIIAIVALHPNVL